MTIYIVGAGGIGVAMACALSRGELDACDLIVVESDREKLNAGQHDGFCVAGFQPVKLPSVAFEDWAPDSGSLILLCTKTFDNAAVLERIPSDATLIPIQNGFDPLLERHDHGIEAIASFVSECERHRPLTRITRGGDLHIGARRALTEAESRHLDRICALLSHGELFPLRRVDDIRPYKAAKLMYNAAISPLAASSGIDNAELLSDPLAKRYFFALLRENYAILKQAGQELAKIGPVHPDTAIRILRTPGLAALMSQFFKPSLRGTYCSMAPDIGTPRTEIDAYNGHLVKLAGDFPCPLNRAAVALVRRMTDQRLAPARERLLEFAELAGTFQ